MVQHDVSAFSKRMTILVGLSVVGAMAFGLAVSFYQNILFEQTLHDISDQNRELREAIGTGLDQLAYFRSRQYRDRYAKQNLGRVNTGEKVLILTDEKDTGFRYTSDTTSRAEQKEAAYMHFLLNTPTIEHWRLYFFERAGLRSLRKSL